MTLLALLLEASDTTNSQQRAVAEAERVLGRPVQPGTLTCVHSGIPISGRDIQRSLSYVTQRLGAYEIPATYRVELSEGGRHSSPNVGWMLPLHINYELRGALKGHLRLAGVRTKATSTALDKMQVKAYCTDKVTMPTCFSNRDIRWATWPDSFQYASHFQCAMIELELMAELYEFSNAPGLDITVVERLEAVLGRPILPGQRRCFVTGRPLDFAQYAQAASNPRGGHSVYHVGHVVPLTRGGHHQWTNIAWMSDDGNRIQGNDTVGEIEAKLVAAVEYHLRRDMGMAPPPQGFYDKVERPWALLNDVREYVGRGRIPW